MPTLVVPRRVPYRNLFKNVHEALWSTDFDSGLGGWDGLKSGSLLLTTAANMYKWPTLTSEQSMSGNLSLKLDAGTGTSNTAVAVKRGPLYRGRLRFSTYVAWNGTGENWLRFLRFALDTQDPTAGGGTGRWWFELRYTHFDQTAVDVTGTWTVETGTASASVMSSTLLSYILPFNEWQKVNWHYLEIIVDTNAMKYESFTIDNVFTDLSAYAPTKDTALDDFVFDNGFNVLVYCQNRSNTSSANSWAYIDEPSLEWIS